MIRFSNPTFISSSLLPLSKNTRFGDVHSAARRGCGPRMWTSVWEAPVATAKHAPRFVDATRHVVVVASSSSRKNRGRTDGRRQAIPQRWGRSREATPGRASGVVNAFHRDSVPDGTHSETSSSSKLDNAERALYAAQVLSERLAIEAGDLQNDDDDDYDGDTAEKSADKLEVHESADDRPAVSFHAHTTDTHFSKHGTTSTSSTTLTPHRKRKRERVRERVRDFLRRARGLRAPRFPDEALLLQTKTLDRSGELKKAQWKNKGKSLLHLLQSRKVATGGLRGKRAADTSSASTAASTSKRADASNKTKQKKRTKLDPYDSLRGAFSKEKLRAFFKRRPGQVARRLATVMRVGVTLLRLWRSEENIPNLQDRTRGVALRDALSNLGPVFVKIGQTLSQRSDLIGDEAADALKLLQNANKPFPDEIAWATIAEDLGFDGPLAPGHVSTQFCADPTTKPLFQFMTDTPIAAASLGQVYKARTWDGFFVAVKVQRPNVLRQVALDWTVWSLCLSALKKAWRSKTNLGDIADEVGVGVFKELDYVNEARNMDLFNKKHDWLGFVRAPFWYREFTGKEGTAKVLTTEWIEGRHISEIADQPTRLRMAQMAVEACVAQLTYTGFVHADPHEGNILLEEGTGELVFLDFGLVATVDEFVMEGFAKGIQCMIAGDWLGLTYVFRDVGMCPPESFYRKVFVDHEGEVVGDDGTSSSGDGTKKDEEGTSRNGDSSKKTSSKVDEDGTSQKASKKKKLKRKKVEQPCSAEEMASAIEQCLTTETGGRTRFGALATGLSGMSGEYKFLTPPYIVLLVRTFLTLEGIAQKADPEFNIYAASLPYAIRRAMAPATAVGKTAMRDAFLCPDDNSVRWDRIEALMGNGDDTRLGNQSENPSADATRVLATKNEPVESNAGILESGGVDFVDGGVPFEFITDQSGLHSAEVSAHGSMNDRNQYSLGEPLPDALTAAALSGESLLNEVFETAASAASAASSSSTDSVTNTDSGVVTDKDAGKQLIAKRSRDVVGRLMGSSDGAALRRVASDANSVDVARYLASDEARPLRGVGVATMTAVLRDVWTVRRAALEAKRAGSHSDGSLTSSSASRSSSSDKTRNEWPESRSAKAIRQREDKTKRRALKVIFGSHLKKLVEYGPRGFFLIAVLIGTAGRMSALAVVFAVVDTVKDWLGILTEVVLKGIARVTRGLAKGKLDMAKGRKDKLPKAEDKA